MSSRKQLPRELPAIALILLLSAWLIRLPNFRNGNNLSSIGENAAFIGLMACGEAAVVLTGGIDLSAGSILALSACVAAVSLEHGWYWPLAMSAALVAGALCGAINGFLITRRNLPPILTTLATLLIFRHGASIATDARNYGPFPAAFNAVGAGWTPLLLFAGAAATAQAIQLRSRAGRWVVAVGAGENIARLAGVPVQWVRMGVYTFSGICAAGAGIVVAAFNNNAQSTIGQGSELDVVAACVVGGVSILGGRGSVAGAALGALLIALLRDGLVLTGRPAEQYGLFTGSVILASALVEAWRAGRPARQARAARA